MLCVCSDSRNKYTQLQLQHRAVNFWSNGTKYAGRPNRRSSCFQFKILTKHKIRVSRSPSEQATAGERRMHEHNYSVPLIESRCEASAGLNDDRFNGNTTL